MKESVKYKFFSAACKVTAPVTREKVGDISDGWWATGGGFKDIAAASSDGDPWVVAARQWLADAGLGYKDPIYNQGLYFGWTLAQSIMIAGELDGGLTRTNFMVAMRTIDMTNPQFLEGIKFNMNGNADAFFLEGSDISQWSVARSRTGTSRTSSISQARRRTAPTTRRPARATEPHLAGACRRRCPGVARSVMEIGCGFASSFEAARQAQVAEALGYDYIGFYDSPALEPDVWLTVADALRATERITVGTYVLIPHLRHPLAQASTIATLSSAGRVGSRSGWARASPVAWRWGSGR